MTTKERLHAELERMTEEEQAKLLRLAQQMRPAPRVPGLLSKIRDASFDGPEDFAESCRSPHSPSAGIGNGTLALEKDISSPFPKC